MSLEIVPRPLRTGGLAREYLAGNPAAGAHYAGDPFALDSFLARQQEIEARFARAERERAAAALTAPSEEARRKLVRFVEHGGAVVVTGQQAGLFTGPLFTVYKALTAVRLAASLESMLGIVVLPVFWTASEDHDWAEVNHTYGVDDRDSLRRLEVHSDDTRPLPMSERLLGEEVISTVDELGYTLATGKFKEEVLNLIRATYQPDRTVADAFRLTMADLFRDFDLLFTDAAAPALKSASVPVLQSALAHAERDERILRETAERIAHLGFTPQVPILPRGANLFLRTRFGRERLYRDSRGWTAHESGERYSTTELEALLATEPGRLSPNVLLRPVVEGAVFPVLAYVAGPGEITYFGQLLGLFEAHGVGMPVVYPRGSMLLLEQRAQRHLDRTGLSATDLLRPRQELLRGRSGSLMPAETAEALRELRQSIVAGFDELDRQATAIDPTLSLGVGSRRNRALLTVKQAEEKILRALTRRDAAWHARVEAAAHHLAPHGVDQERMLNLMPYLARHGRAVLSAMAERIVVARKETATPLARGMH